MVVGPFIRADPQQETFGGEGLLDHPTSFGSGGLPTELNCPRSP
jgi:hypothetical protein